MNDFKKINTFLGTLALASMFVFSSQVATAAPSTTKDQDVAATSAEYSPDTGSEASSVDTEATENSKEVDAEDANVDVDAANIGSETEAADISSETPDVGDIANEVANSTPED